LIEKLFLEAGFPKNLVTVVQGGGEVGQALIEVAPDKVLFTGSVATGRRVAEACANKLIPSVLELGGKDAMIVLGDADLDVEALYCLHAVHEACIEERAEQHAPALGRLSDRQGGTDVEADDREVRRLVVALGDPGRRGRRRRRRTRRGQRTQRVYTDAERAYCESKANPAQSYAARFAGKEAVGKALGCGVDFSWREIEIVGRPKPGVRLSGRTAAFAEKVRAGAIDLSMTHSRELAQAVAVATDA
jgi:holo-[acyl-carrier-protein] synthase